MFCLREFSSEEEAGGWQARSSAAPLAFVMFAQKCNSVPFRPFEPVKCFKKKNQNAPVAHTFAFRQKPVPLLASDSRKLFQNFHTTSILPARSEGSTNQVTQFKIQLDSFRAPIHRSNLSIQFGWSPVGGELNTLIASGWPGPANQRITRWSTLRFLVFNKRNYNVKFCAFNHEL